MFGVNGLIEDDEWWTPQRHPYRINVAPLYRRIIESDMEEQLLLGHDIEASRLPPVKIETSPVVRRSLHLPSGSAFAKVLPGTRLMVTPMSKDTLCC